MGGNSKTHQLSHHPPEQQHETHLLICSSPTFTGPHRCPGHLLSNRSRTARLSTPCQLLVHPLALGAEFIGGPVLLLFGGGKRERERETIGGGRCMFGWSPSVCIFVLVSFGRTRLERKKWRKMAVEGSNVLIVLMLSRGRKNEKKCHDSFQLPIQPIHDGFRLVIPELFRSKQGPCQVPCTL